MVDAAARMMDLFSGFESAHGTHAEPIQRPGSLKWEIRSSAATLREPVTLDLWQDHLTGKRPLGVIAIREDNTCMWGSIDYDVYDIDLTSVIRRAEELENIKLVPCRSKSGGLHLFLFLQQPTPAAEIVEILRDLAARIGVGGSEVFPKQVRVLKERGDLGSWMIMPYFGGTYGGRLAEQVGLRVTGTELTIDEFIRAADKARVPPEAIAGYVKARRRKDKTNSTEETGKPFGDGPPCLQHLASEKIPLGGQNNALFMMGLYYKKAFPGDWKKHLEEAGRVHLDPPASSDAMQSLIKSLERKEYEYTCNNEPMASHCNARLCRTRRHGVGSWGDYPTLDGLSVLKTDPVIWFVDVDNERLEVSTADLQNYIKFHAVCMEKTQRCYKLMRQDNWLRQVNEAMSNVVAIDPPPDSKPEAQMHELLEEFLVNRTHGNRPEDLLSGRPWTNEDENRLEFRLRDLLKFLKREGQQEISRGRLIRMIQKMDGGHGFRTIAGKGVNYWWLNADLFSKVPEVSVPKQMVKEVM
jgi:hypothetical protein